MKIENSVVGGFDPPSKGWHDFEILDDLQFKVDDADNETATLIIHAKVVNNPVEEGRRITINTDLSKPGGQRTLALILGHTKIAGWLEKNLALNAELNEKEWGATYLNTEAAEYDKIMNNVFQKLAFKQFSGKVVLDVRERKDGAVNEDGTKATVTFANIREFNVVGYKGAEGTEQSAQASAAAGPAGAGASKRSPRPIGQRPKPVSVPKDDEDYTSD